MDIETLRDFLLLSEQRNFTKTARLLNISQSSLTRRIASLEGELGCPLFDRERTPVELSDEGRALCSDIEGLVHAHDMVVKKARSLKKRVPQQFVTIGGMASSRPTADPVRRAVAALAESRPGIGVKVVEETDRPFLDCVLDGELDITFIVAGDMVLHHMTSMGFACTFMHSYPFMLLAPPSSPLYAHEGDAVAPAELEGERLVLFRNRLWPQTCSRFHEVVDFVPGIDVYERSVLNLGDVRLDDLQGAVLVLIAGVLERLPVRELSGMRLMHIAGQENEVETYVVRRREARSEAVETVVEEILRARRDIPSDFMEQDVRLWEKVREGAR